MALSCHTCFNELSKKTHLQYCVFYGKKLTRLERREANVWPLKSYEILWWWSSTSSSWKMWDQWWGLIYHKADGLAGWNSNTNQVMKLNSSSQQRNLKYISENKMDAKYTNRVPESRESGESQSHKPWIVPLPLVRFQIFRGVWLKFQIPPLRMFKLKKLIRHGFFSQVRWKVWNGIQTILVGSIVHRFFSSKIFLSPCNRLRIFDWFLFSKTHYTTKYETQYKKKCKVHHEKECHGYWF